MSYILTANKLENNRSKEPNDFVAIYNIVTQGRAIDTKLSETIQLLVTFLQSNTINIYKGVPLLDPKGMEKFATCISVVYYFFMFERTSGDNFVSK